VGTAQVRLRGQDCGQPVRDVKHAVAESPVPIKGGHLHFVAADELPCTLFVVHLREARQEALLIGAGLGVLQTGFELRIERQFNLTADYAEDWSSFGETWETNE